MTTARSDTSEQQSATFTEGMASTAIDEMLTLEVTRIFEGYKRRMALSSHDHANPAHWGESAQDWMLAEVYLLVRQLIAIRKVNALNRAIVKAPKGRKGRRDMSNQPFKQALFLIFGKLMVSEGDSPLDRRRRSQLGEALTYANAHDVPAAYLNGFIKQAGLAKCRAKLKAGYEEPRSGRDDIIIITSRR